MATLIDTPVLITSRNNHDLLATPGTIVKVVFDQKDRTKNAVKMFWMLLAATFCAVFVPILHFVLVPSLFIATFVVTMSKYGEKSRNTGGHGECPKCHQTFVIEKSGYNDRLTDTCDHCHDDLEIKVVHPENAAAVKA
jgi:hypothetical protein